MVFSLFFFFCLFNCGVFAFYLFIFFLDYLIVSALGFSFVLLYFGNLRLISFTTDGDGSLCKVATSLSTSSHGM